MWRRQTLQWSSCSAGSDQAVRTTACALALARIQRAADRHLRRRRPHIVILPRWRSGRDSGRFGISRRGESSLPSRRPGQVA